MKELIGEGEASPTLPAVVIDIEEMDAPFVVAKTAKLRAQPAAQSRQVGRLAVDDAVTVTGKVKGRDWYRVAHRGSTAYVFAPLLTAVTPSPAVPAMRVPRTTAARVVFLDAASGRVLFEKAADEAFEPGSMSKLMTVYMVLEGLRDGRLSLDDTFSVSETAWRKGGAKSGSSTMFLKPGSRVRIEDLLRGIVVQSGNDASIVIAEGLSGSEERFALEMNQRARELGLERTNFVNATGWPDPEHRTTARDLARLAKRTISDFPQYYHYYAEKNFTYNGIRQGNRNPLLYKDLGADGLKTGHGESSGYSLVASAVRGGKRGILVISGLSGTKEKAAVAKRLIALGLSRLAAPGPRLAAVTPQKPAKPAAARILIRAKSASWIQVRVGVRGPLLMTRQMRAGDTYRVPDRPGLKLVVGNAGALDILVDGKVVPAIGPPGAVLKGVALDAERLRKGNAAAN